MSNIKKAYTKICNSLDQGYKALVECLKEHGRFVNMSKPGDAVYAIDYVGIEAVEMEVIAVRLDEASEMVEAYLVPTNENKTAIEDKEWEKREDDDYDSYFEGKSQGYWTPIKDADVLYIHTLCNILECFNYYL